MGSAAEILLMPYFPDLHVCRPNAFGYEGPEAEQVADNEDNDQSWLFE